MNDRDELSRLLRTWQHDPAPSPDFRSGVWRRVGAAQTPSGAGARILRFPLPFALPIAAGFAVILGVSMGLAGSRVEATERMAGAYARSIDPILMMGGDSMGPGTASSHP
ncbi:MAG TPA: hypothetical protein VGD81_01060 [Opitutaceae bacterium]